MMKKYSLKKINTIKNTKSVACLLCLFMTVGCAGSILEPAQSVPDNVSCSDFNSSSSGRCPEYEPYSEEGEFVNYTQVAADFREYGERNPRDQFITQADAGNNISASIPPSIEDEVMDYEEQININEGTMGGVGDSDRGTVDDPVQDWLAEEGQTLRAVLTEWSEKSGWRLVWNTNRNYTITAGAMFRGRFADVSSALIRAFARARPAPIATFYKGNRVLVVETMEDENAYD